MGVLMALAQTTLALGSVREFLDKFQFRVMRYYPGINYYTVSHYGIRGYDLRSSNLSLNPMIPRVGPEAKSMSNFYVYDKYADENGLENPMFYFDKNIGELEGFNNYIYNRDFKDKDGFLNFQSKLRKKLVGLQWYDNNNKYREINSTSYLTAFGLKYLNTYNDSIEQDVNGDFFVVNNSHGSKPYDVKDDKKSVRDLVLNKLTAFNIYRGKNYPEDVLGPEYVIQGISSDKFSEEYEIKDLLKELSQKKGKVQFKIEDTNRNNTLSKERKDKKYWFDNPYGIFRSDNLDYYKVQENRTLSGKKIELDSTFIGGSMLDSFYSEENKEIVSNEDFNINSLNLNSKGKTTIQSSNDSYSNLIKKTNEMFQKNEIGSLINRFYGNKPDLHNLEEDELTTAKSNFGLSKGRNLLSTDTGNDTNGFNNPYCRVWTAHHRYGKLSRLIRPFSGNSNNSLMNVQEAIGRGDNNALRFDNGAERLGNNSVLMDSGFVRISPSHDEEFYDDNEKANIKNYMFSIENLAWRDVNLSANLSKEQCGPNKGRIMWFPPYNLKFNENVNVDWNGNKFIGRGEQIYTYTNTDRSGTLSFTMLIDHPSIINKWRGTAQSVQEPDKREQDILRFFAGYEMLNNSCNDAIVPNDDKKQVEKKESPQMKYFSKEIALMLFFPNNFPEQTYNDEKIEEELKKLKTYETNNEENGKNNNIFNLNDENITSKAKSAIETAFGFDSCNDDECVANFYSFFDRTHGYNRLNDNINNDNIFSDVSKNITLKSVKIFGLASSHEKENIAIRRAEFLRNAILKYCNKIKNNENIITIEESQIVEVGDGINDINALDAKIARVAYAVISAEWDEETMTQDTSSDGNFYVNGVGLPKNEASILGNVLPEVTIIANAEEETQYRADNEYLYFANLRDDEVAYQRVIDRIRYFNPAFHSITPEGFNARLTFLHQCTRQGPTTDLSSGLYNSESTNFTKYAGNLAFGRAPYCILRIGDFFNTKICITSLSIDYDSGSGLQWDLNPEGVGVQPMFANININFNFIGGQDIAGPIERLQNAVTSNYYANASVYDHKADKKGGQPYDVRTSN